ncbi:hypothetical protein BCR36DRAFT_347592 [Piromyces finnis]|uniref:SAP domain-containing protein n=1 Tax=Piromyces finnis TaxID=1754191 RepID=A0A1Y1VF11_9FUNG|nr:hypothetical protein BCR36DRAFT_347592 [Piromyces finnis]|eukprot:ORX54677.1 hypothetical protein BCR36DRAFT_347592 [Piromyces finnis]
MEYIKLKVTELKELLTKRGLTTKGLKADLIERLEKDDLTKKNSKTEDAKNPTEEISNTSSEEKIEKNITNSKKESTTGEMKPGQETPIKNNETEIPGNQKDNKDIQNKEKIVDPQSEPIENDKKSEISKEIKTKDQLIVEEIKKPIESEDNKIESENKKESDKNINKIKKDSNEEKLNKSEINKEDSKNDKDIQEQKKDIINEINSNIPKTEQIEKKDSNVSKKEEISKTTPQIQIVGTSQKENENGNANSKKRPLNTDDTSEESSKKKKTDDSDNISQIKTTAPKDTILINNFVRPLIVRSVKELVAQYGEVKSFWMDSIKSHAYVTYTSIESAEAASKGIHGIKFPEETGKILSVEYISEEESKERIKKEEEKILSVSIPGVGSKSLGSTPIRGRFDTLYASRIGIPIKTSRLNQENSKKSDLSSFSVSPSTTISPSSIARAAASQSIKIIGKNKDLESISISSSPIKEVYASLEVDRIVQSKVSSRYKRTRETSEVSFLHNSQAQDKSKNQDDANKTSLDKKAPVDNEKKKKKSSMDDLFKKTKATPIIYYKPLSEEEVKQKEMRENEERIKSRERLRERERESKRSRRY